MCGWKDARGLEAGANLIGTKDESLDDRERCDRMRKYDLRGMGNSKWVEA